MKKDLYIPRPSLPTTADLQVQISRRHAGNDAVPGVEWGVYGGHVV